MNGTFKNANNIDVPYFMGCYGIGVSRTLAALAEKNSDESGLKWSKEIAPYQVTIIYTNSKKDDAFKLYDYLQDAGVDTVIDDRDSIRIGAKIKDWKLFGIPYLIIIGDRTLDGYCEVESREDGKKFKSNREELVKFFK